MKARIAAHSRTNASLRSSPREHTAVPRLSATRPRLVPHKPALSRVAPGAGFYLFRIS